LHVLPFVVFSQTRGVNDAEGGLLLLLLNLFTKLPSATALLKLSKPDATVNSLKNTANCADKITLPVESV